MHYQTRIVECSSDARNILKDHLEIAQRDLLSWCDGRADISMSLECEDVRGKLCRVFKVREDWTKENVNVSKMVENIDDSMIYCAVFEIGLFIYRFITPNMIRTANLEDIHPKDAEKYADLIHTEEIRRAEERVQLLELQLDIAKARLAKLTK